MALLKAAQFDQSDEKKEIFNLSDIAAEGRAIVEKAKRHRDQMLEKARADIRKERQQALREGHQQGFEQGHEAGRSEGHEQALQEARQEFACEAADALKTLKTTLEHFDQTKQRLLWQAEQDIVTLALAVADKVVKRTGEKERHVAAQNLKAALELIGPTTDVIVKVNAKDIEYLKKMAGNDEQVFGSFATINFELDEGVEPGGCRLCAAQGEIDARLETQLSRIADELLMTTSKEK